MRPATSHLYVHVERDAKSPPTALHHHHHQEVGASGTAPAIGVNQRCPADATWRDRTGTLGADEREPAERERQWRAEAPAEEICSDASYILISRRRQASLTPEIPPLKLPEGVSVGVGVA